MVRLFLILIAGLLVQVFPESSSVAPKVALVLSGGGVRGFAHIGVLKVLERNGIRPSFIAGTSMGAVVGGLYSAGYSVDSLEKIALSADWEYLFRDNPERRDLFYTSKDDGSNAVLRFRIENGSLSLPTALVSGHYILNYLIELTLPAIVKAEFNFDKLPIPFRASATNLVTGERVVIDRGGLAEAMRASLAVPFVFAPFRHDSLLLVDGGFTNVLPIDVALRSGADIILASYVPSPLYSENTLKNPIRFVDQVVSFCLVNQRSREERDSAIVIIPEFNGEPTNSVEFIPGGIAAGERAMEKGLQLLLSRLDSVSAVRHYERVQEGKICDGKKSHRRFAFSGNTVYSDSIIRSDLVLGVDKVRERYLSDGYSLVSVNIDTKNDSATLIAIKEGRIANISVKGNARTNRTIIDRELSIRVGRLFNAKEMKADVRNLLATGLFESVYFSISSVDSTGASIVIIVKEKPPDVFSLGARYDNIRLLEGFVQYDNVNVAGRALTVDALIQYGLRRERYLVGLKTDRFSDSYFTADAKAFFYRDRKFVQDAFDSTKYSFNYLRKLGATASIAHQILRMGKLSYVLMVEQYRSSEDESYRLDNPLKYEALRIASIRAELDYYDRKYFPTKGYKIYSSADMGLGFLGDKSGFFNLTVTGSSALALTERFTLLPAMFFSISDVKLPDPVKNYLGGATEIRMNNDIVLYNSFPLYGFEEQAFTSEALSVFRLALCIKLLNIQYIKVIANSGMLWQPDVSLMFKSSRGLKLYHGMGLEYSADIPRIGPASLSVSVPLFSKDEKSGKPYSPILYLSVGHDF